MQCQQCGELVEQDARFCGNCGEQQQAVAIDMRTAALAGTPQYARATPLYHTGEVQAWLSVLCGLLGIVGGLFIALTGLVFGVTGLVLGTLARTSPRRHLSMIGIMLSITSVLTGLAVWVYAVSQDPQAQNSTIPDTAQTSRSAIVATPCYAVGFATQLTVQNSVGSCSMQAYDGQTMSTSTAAYKVFAHELTVSDEETFYNLAKTEIKKDLTKNLPSFTIESEGITTFAGSPAYLIKASDKTTKTSVVEAVVLRRVNNGENVFVLVHASSQTDANLQSLEAQWQWK